MVGLFPRSKLVGFYSIGPRRDARRRGTVPSQCQSPRESGQGNGADDGQTRAKKGVARLGLIKTSFTRVAWLISCNTCNDGIIVIDIIILTIDMYLLFIRLITYIVHYRMSLL